VKDICGTPEHVSFKYSKVRTSGKLLGNSNCDITYIIIIIIITH